jgi:hypothetical protein
VIDPAPAAEALTWPDKAASLAVNDAPTYTIAGEFLKGIKALRARIADTFDPHITRAFQAHKALVKEKADAEAPLQVAERAIKDKLVAFDKEQERLRLAEQRRLEEAARQAEETRRLAEASAMEAEALANGDMALQAEAEALIAAPVETPVVFIEKATPKVAGLAYRLTYSAEVVNLAALVGYVAAHPESANLLLPNTVALNQMARAMKTALRLPGVKVIEKRDIAAGSR